MLKQLTPSCEPDFLTLSLRVDSPNASHHQVTFTLAKSMLLSMADEANPKDIAEAKRRGGINYEVRTK
jgi:hypothetical protein